MKRRLPKELRGPFVVGRYDRSKARLYLKRPSGEIQSVDDVYPALFVAKPQMKHFPMDAFPEVFLDTTKEGRYYRVNMKPRTTRTKVDEIINLCRRYNVYPMEADVDPIRRWFSDTGSTISPNTKALFFDLETNPEVQGFDDDAKKTHQLLSCSLTDYQTGKKWFLVNKTLDDEGEAKLLNEFIRIAEDFDTLLAWNGDNYDFFVLRHRAKHLKIKINWKQWNLLDYMLTVKKCLMSISDPTFKRSFALDNLGQNVLGIKKLKVKVGMGELKRLVLEDRVNELQLYNDRDVEIMVELEKAREFMTLHLAVCSICRKFPDPNSLFPNALMDGLMLRLAVKENRHFKSRLKELEEEDLGKFPGAYVMDARVGFHEQVQVIDFSSLYPSIIISWNMSPDTKLWDGRTYPDVRREEIATATATGVRFRTDFEGMLPKAERTLIERRKLYAGKQKNAIVGSDEWKRYGHESTALKVVANSMYGLLGSQYSRYYDRDIASSVTLSGQLLIKACIEFAENRGLDVIGSDTDSCFVKADEETTKQLIIDINDELIPSILYDSGCKTHRVKMDFDKGYHYLLVQAKKKYAGKLSLHKGRPAPDTMEPDVKGLEFQRSDQIRFAQKMQMHFLHFLLKPDANADEIEKELRKWADRFMHDDIPLEDIEITQGVKKHPSQYDTPTPVVRVAQQLIDAGVEFFPGMKVGYVVKSSKDKVEGMPSSQYTGTFDRLYYWTNRVLPPVLRLIEARFPGHVFYDLVTMKKNPNQQTFDFTEAPVKQRDVKMPKRKTKKVKKVKLEKVILEFKEQRSVDKLIVGVSKLVKGSEKGNKRLFIRCVMEGVEVDISTLHCVTNQCLREIKELFPSVEIEHKPI